MDREDGRTVVYEVYRVDQFAKDAFPTVDVYGSTPGPELLVITCGGEWNGTQYTTRVVVIAKRLEVRRPVG